LTIAERTDVLVARLLEAIDAHGPLAIAVSGGADSMTLAHLAWRFARSRPAMYHAVGPAVPSSARERVDAHAARHGWPLTLIDAGEQADPRYRANPVDRCYYCKTNLYARIRAVTDQPIASGTNLDDLQDFRPGLRAAGEHQVVHPYVEAGIGKVDVYRLASYLSLDDLERLPAQPCLASRVETGIAIAPDDLAFVDAVEARLAERLGREAVQRCRVTHSGIVVELADVNDADRVQAVEAIARDACTAHGRRFGGVRRYVRGAAFLRPVHE
jgi:pyridinium-3,5-biscarboxylic acid mononucleotide sulfurtransferase